VLCGKALPYKMKKAKKRVNPFPVNILLWSSRINIGQQGFIMYIIAIIMPKENLCP
jgi:hypothetical protein